MTREFGEKSYNPQTFRMDYWGNWETDFGNSIYWKLFERRLPGNILLAAYDKPVTITELSIELGVAVVYLEDEVQILEKHEIMKKIGDKYQTNIIIFTEDYEKRALEKFQPIYQETAEQVYHQVESLLPEFTKLEFYGNHYDKNRLKWLFCSGNIGGLCAEGVKKQMQPALPYSLSVKYNGLYHGNACGRRSSHHS